MSIDSQQKQKVTDKFYQDFNSLLQLILSNNKENKIEYLPTLSENELIKIKSEFYRTVFLRILFIHILVKWKILPLNPIKTILDKHPNSHSKLLSNLFFNVLNQKKTDRGEKLINEFKNLPYLSKNLFKKTEIELENPKIRLSSTTYININNLLNRYNFINSEDRERIINPEIIGYIFEKTITLTGGNQIQTGSYYTPELITKLMAKDVLDIYLENKLKKHSLEIFGLEINSQDIDNFNPEKIKLLLKILIDVLKNSKICDIAIGTGAFPKAICDEFVIRFKDIYEKLNWELPSISHNKIQNDPRPFKDLYRMKLYIVQNNFHGVDINPDAIELCKLRMWLWLIEPTNEFLKNTEFISKGEFFPDIEYNYRTGNSLICQSENFSSFIWFDEFKSIMDEGGFDIIVGNPPYLGQSGNRETFELLAELLPEYSEGKMDLWYYFIHIGLELLKPNGIISFITSNYWKTASGASKLRNEIMNNKIHQYLDFKENKIFSNAKGIHTNIIIIEKRKYNEDDYVECYNYTNTYENLEEVISKRMIQSHFMIRQNDIEFNSWNNYLHFLQQETLEIIKIVYSNSFKLKSIFKSLQGIVTGLNKITQSKIDKFNLDQVEHNDGVFILDTGNQNDLNIINSFNTDESNLVHAVYKNSNILQYKITPTNLKIIYLDSSSSLHNKPKIKSHIDRFKPVLDTRRETKSGQIKYFQLQWSREPELFLRPKICHTYRNKFNNFAFTNNEFYSTQDTYYIVEKSNEESKLKRLLLLLNSAIGYFIFNSVGKKKGDSLELFGEPIEDFPIPNRFEEFEVEILADYLQFLAINDEDLFFKVKKIIDILVFEIYFISLLAEEHKIYSNNDLILINMIKHYIGDFSSISIIFDPISSLYDTLNNEEIKVHYERIKNNHFFNYILASSSNNMGN